MIYVADTQPLVFWSSDRKNRLGPWARKIFQEVEQGKHTIVVPLVVLEETARLIERKVVRFTVSFRRWAEELDRSANFQVQPYTIEILLGSVSLGTIRDPADKAIVASARQLRCPLITADDLIRDGNWIDTVWD